MNHTDESRIYTECKELLKSLNLNIGDLEDYYIKKKRKRSKLISFLLTILTAILLFPIAIGHNNSFSIFLDILVFFAIMIKLASIGFNIVFIPAMSPYKRSDLIGSLYFLDKSLKDSNKQTLKYLHKVSKFKNAKS